jgi:hypothetical protein
MRLSACLVVCSCLFVSLLAPTSLVGQQFASVVIWSEPGLPAADSPAPSAAQLAQVFPEARLASADQLSAQLSDPQTRLLILAQGSVMPEAAWSVISRYLERGGNLLVVGGRPFTRAAYQDATGWHLRDYSVRFSRLLLVDQYQTTPGASGAEFVPNPDFPLELPRFSWQEAYSPIIRLSTRDLYDRGGSAGSLDVHLHALVWGVQEGRRVSAPVIELDHLSSGFDGGRWIFVAAKLPPDFYSSPESTVFLRRIASRAIEGAEEFSVRPTVPLYLPGEPIELETVFNSSLKPARPLTIQVTINPEDQPLAKQTATITLPCNSATILPAPHAKGLYLIQARLLDGTSTRAIYHSAFWIRDKAYLLSGPRLSVNADYFQLDDNPLAVVGTTYMSSEVQRLYFDHPNVYVWNNDMALIHGAGLNTIRTGWWTGWDKFCDETGRPYERTLRTLEAFLMTARKNGLPVQFNFFAFLPEVLGGANAYLDPQAVRKQQTLIGAVVGNFSDLPFLAWDLINEPSFSKHLWRMRPNEDPIELAAWNAWLLQKYPDRGALAEAWNVPPDAVAGTISLPSELEFDPRGMYDGRNSLRVYDYALFAQDKFAGWVRGMREVIRATGSTQPITVGQDEGGFMDRLSPAFFAPSVDFTTNHSWWQDDHLLWDSLVAKQPGRAMLIQETGLQRELNVDETSRLTPEQEASLFERKVALSFVQGSGAIEWLWNTNSYMTQGNEVPIGALHADGTEKPEATVLRNFAKFAATASPYLKNPQPPDIAVLTSQAAQFSIFGAWQVEAQQKAVRALGYDLHQPCYIIAESQIEKLGSPKLVILPSAQALRESTWQALLAYVKNGGNLLVTGAVSRDEHWHLVDRLSPLGIKVSVKPLTFHNASLVLGPKYHPASNLVVGPIELSFDQQKQQSLEYLDFPDPSDVASWGLEKGRLFWAAYPVELSEGSAATSAFYEAILNFLDFKPLFAGRAPPPPGVLAYRLDLQDATLYILESEYHHSQRDQKVDLNFQDSVTGALVKLPLHDQHAALVLIDKHSKQIVARYGF